MKVKLNNLLKIYNHEVSKNTKNKNKVYNYEKYKFMNIINLKEELETEKYCIQKYNIFSIHEPKLRIIMSLSIKDRIVDHYIARYILIPKLEKYLDIRNIASRKNMGLDYGIKLLKKYLEKLKKHNTIYALKIDISKYFYTIDHKILKKMLKEKLTDEEYKLVSLFIDSTDKNYVNIEINKIKNKLLKKAKTEKQINEIKEIPFYETGKGLTIGNVSSQILSVFYLSEIDFYIINNLKCKYMIRYCDDFIILHHDKKYLQYIFNVIENKLNNYNLRINKKKSNITNIKNGIVFCGNLVKVKNKKTIILKCRKNRNRINHNLKKKQILYNNKKITFKNYFSSINSMIKKIKYWK